MGPVVIDSNLAIALAVPTSYSILAKAKLGQWFENEIEITVPVLWGYEVTTAMRKYVSAGFMSEEDASNILVKILSLNVTILTQTIESHKKALIWAGKIGQFIAYDAQYLALAEQTGADFWTADRRLAHLAQQAGANWVHWLGEAN